jgi:hypothetical protein
MNENGRVSMKTYFIFNATAETVKIGRSTDPQRRLKDLQCASSSELAMLGVFEEDIEKRLHEELKDYRVSGEWFTWTEPVRAAIRSLKITGLPPVKDLREPSRESSVDWIAEAERIAGSITTEPLAPLDLAQMLEEESWEDAVEGLVQADLEELAGYITECSKYTDSEEWVSENHQELFGGYAPMFDDELLENYLIGYAVVKRKSVSEYVLFFHEPHTLGAQNKLAQQCLSIVMWTDPFDRTAFTVFMWDKAKSRFFLLCSDGAVRDQEKAADDQDEHVSGNSVGPYAIALVGEFGYRLSHMLEKSLYQRLINGH